MSIEFGKTALSWYWQTLNLAIWIIDVHAIIFIGDLCQIAELKTLPKFPALPSEFVLLYYMYMYIIGKNTGYQGVWVTIGYINNERGYTLTKWLWVLNLVAFECMSSTPCNFLQTIVCMFYFSACSLSLSPSPPVLDTFIGSWIFTWCWFWWSFSFLSTPLTLSSVESR